MKKFSWLSVLCFLIVVATSASAQNMSSYEAVYIFPANGQTGTVEWPIKEWSWSCNPNACQLSYRLPAKATGDTNITVSFSGRLQNNYWAILQGSTASAFCALHGVNGAACVMTMPGIQSQLQANQDETDRYLRNNLPEEQVEGARAVSILFFNDPRGVLIIRPKQDASSSPVFPIDPGPAPAYTPIAEPPAP